MTGVTCTACTATLYTCYGDGKAKENHQTRKTTKTRKHPGSRKLAAYCISRMTVTKGKSGTVSVRYIQTHTNHTPGIGEVKHIPLPQAVRQEIKEKYGQNVKLNERVPQAAVNTLMTDDGTYIYIWGNWINNSY